MMFYVNQIAFRAIAGTSDMTFPLVRNACYSGLPLESHRPAYISVPLDQLRNCAFRSWLHSCRRVGSLVRFRVTLEYGLPYGNHGIRTGQPVKQNNKRLSGLPRDSVLRV